MSEALTSDDVLDIAGAAFEGVAEMERWGERSLFYNPDHQLPHGVYFLTVKEHDGPLRHGLAARPRRSVPRQHRGRSSVLRRRVQASAASPREGGIVDTGHDFTALDTLKPHPVYGWMGWVCVLNPTRATLEQLEPLIAEAHRHR